VEEKAVSERGGGGGGGNSARGGSVNILVVHAAWATGRTHFIFSF